MRVLDVGCGDGDFLFRSAAARPDVEHVGIDLLRPVIERAEREAEKRGLSNLRFLAGDAVAWLARQPAGSFDEIHVYHPQPYLDPAEQHLGMLAPAFFERLWIALRPAGLLVLQTDAKAYGRYLLEAVQKHFDAEVLPGPWPEGPRTRREKTAAAKKLRVLRVRARRRDVPLNVEMPAPYFERPGLRRRRLKKRKC